MVNIDPPEELPEHWHKDFRGLYRDCIIDKRESFNEEEYRNDLRDNISKQKEHRELLNMCVFPFTKQTTTPSGYRFIRADPLEELGVPNFDFLLYDLNGHAIFGEVKANVPKQVDRIINEVAEQKKQVKDNIDYISENYLLGEEPDISEYVLGVFTSDAEEVTRKAMSSDHDIITWAVDRYKKQISINRTLPESLPEDSEAESLEEEFKNLRLRFRHSVNGLNSALQSEKSSTECFDLFPESGRMTKLRTIITASRSEGRFAFVDEADIRMILEEDLFYVSEDRLEKLVETIIEAAEEIGFLKQWDDDRAEYKIVSRYTHSDGLEETLTKKWCDFRVRKKYVNFQQQCRGYATEQVGRQSQLPDF